MYMLIKEIQELLSAKVYAGKALMSVEVINGSSSDDMNMVMAFAKKKAVLITGLVTDNAVRTAKMMNIRCIVFVRGKKPDDEVIRLADELRIALLVTDHRMFESCGILYGAGLGRTTEGSVDDSDEFDVFAVLDDK